MLNVQSILVLISSERLITESEADRAQCLAANQQQGANYRASESETECTERLAANQQREVNHRASESEVERALHLAAGQQ